MSYQLARDYRFDKPHVVKIRCFHGSRSHVFCSVDFVEASDVNGELVPLLGSSIEGSNSWVPLSNGYIPAHGWIRFWSVYDSDIKRLGNVTIWIEIVPASDAEYK